MRRRGAIALLLGVSACGRHLYSFSGGNALAGIKTVAVLPFENETLSSELPREIADALREGLEKRLGMRAASEEKANAVVRGKIVQYDLDVPVAIGSAGSGSSTARRRLTIGLNIELVQQSDGKVLWTKSNMTAYGDYAERAEAAGRKQAIERIVSEVIDGAQSQW